MTGLVILAAGESSRLGEPKQKIIYEGKTLLLRAVEAALGSSCTPIILVLGASYAEIETQVKDKGIIIYKNALWQEGMASSIRAGIRALEKAKPKASAAILMVCDQPFVDSKLLQNMINTQATSGKGIIACSYNKTLGVPVLFSKTFFLELSSLKGQEGAKKLIMQHKENVAEISFPLGSFDIDTKEDYNSLIAGRPTA